MEFNGGVKQNCNVIKISKKILVQSEKTETTVFDSTCDTISIW